MPEELISIGRILRAVGLDGLCAVESFGSSFDILELPVEVFIGLDEKTACHAVIEEIQRRPKGIVCRFKGINTLQFAEQIRGCLIFITAGMLPALDKQEFYHFELKGMAVYSDNNRQVGVVEEVYNFPTTDSLELRRMDGELILIPMNVDSIVSIDKDRRRIVIRQDFLEELLEG